MKKFKKVLVTGLACLTLTGLGTQTFAMDFNKVSPVDVTNEVEINPSEDIMPLGVPYEEDIYASDGDAVEYFEATGVWRLDLTNNSESDLIFYVYDKNGDKLGIGKSRLKPGEEFTSGLVPGIEDVQVGFKVKMYVEDGLPLSAHLKIRDDMPVR